ncbi:MAG TPA: ROK family transcriptional regulator [Solirubrobacterales bacterium]|nr:ROK family transcriptional regulator [Solirubrobacterales bacterium]
MYQTTVNDINEFLVRDAIRDLGEVTRGDLSKRLGLSPASVSRIVRRLVEAGTVTQVSASSSPGPGRSSDIIRFNHRSGAVIAVDLGGTKCHGVLADLAAETLAEDYRPTHADGTPAETLIATIDALRDTAGGSELPVHAVVVGIPAVPDPDTGLVGSGPNVDWEGYDLIGLLRDHLSEPFRIENDVTLAAIGQAWRGEGQAANGFVTLSIGTGIGAAAFANGQVLRGRHNAAGEIGTLLMSRDQLRAEPGTVSGLESVASGPAIVRRALELLDSGRDSTLRAEGLTAQNVFEAAGDSDPVALEVIEEVLDYVAITVIDLAAVLDPERIILDGSVGRALEPYTDALVERIGWRLLHVPSVHFSRLGPNATVTGAIAGALALDRETDARRTVAELPEDGLRMLATLPSYGEPADGSSDPSVDSSDVP